MFLAYNETKTIRIKWQYQKKQCKKPRYLLINFQKDAEQNEAMVSQEKDINLENLKIE